MPRIKPEPQLTLTEEKLDDDELLPLLTVWQSREADAKEARRYIKQANDAKKAVLVLLPPADGKGHQYRVGVYTIKITHVHDRHIAFDRGESRRVTIHSEES